MSGKAVRVVGVGASAGGLEALVELFQGVPTDCPICWVVVQHLSADVDSAMPDLLERRTLLEVVPVHEGLSPRPGTIVLNRPGIDMTLHDGIFRIEPWPDGRSTRYPIDRLFTSLAEQGADATGIVLSGTGSDGTLGLAALHAAGGLTVVQHPATARFAGMPESAIRGTRANLVLPPSDIGAALAEHLVDPVPSDRDGSRPAPRQAMDRIATLLERRHRIRLALYKPATMERRIERRMRQLAIDDAGAYAEHLAADPSEVDALYSDLFVGVTAFERDSDVFAVVAGALDAHPDLRAGTPFRAWVPACATGEEAYTLAILLLERAADPESVKVFATDIHPPAVRTASAGIYAPERLEKLSTARRERWFQALPDGRYQVRPALRDRVLFATHDLLRDPPFSRMQLVTCRNLLIYLNAEGQRCALDRLTFALVSPGLLLLGRSETPSSHLPGLEVVDPRARLFRKVGPLGSITDDVRAPRPALPSRATARPSMMQMLAYDELLDRFAPPGLLLDDQLSLLHVFGGAARFLQQRAGRPTLDALDRILPPLRATLASTFREAQRSRSAATAVAWLDDETVQVEVQPLALRDGSRAYLARFGPTPRREADPIIPRPVDVDHGDDVLGDELAWARHSLQIAMEVAESANEELQAANEELIAANEELQSTNEELQSVNEELHTVNAEYQVKYDELQMLNDDLANLLDSTELGVLFLDRDLAIRRFTDAIAGLFPLRAGDIGRPLADLCTRAIHHEAFEAAHQVLREGTVADRRVELDGGRTGLFQVRPYRADGRIQGAVLTLVDVTDLQQAQESLALQQRVLDIMSLGVGIWRLEDPTDAGSFRFLYANPAFDGISQLRRATHLGQTAGELAAPDIVQTVFEQWRQVVRTGETRVDVFHHEQPQGGRPTVVRTLATRGPNQTVVVIYEDATAASERQREEEHERTIRSIGQVSGSIAHDLNNLLGAILLTTRGDGPPDPDAAAIVHDAAQRAADLVAQLLTYAKRRPVSPQRVELDALLRGVAPMLERLAGPSTSLRWHVAPATPPVRIDPLALEQVFVNLVTNARAALAGAPGHLAIDVQCRAQGTGSVVEIEIADDGPGMPPEVRDRCFEPFFTTQPPGLGTGLGLSSAQGAIAQAGGSIRVASTLGEGTRFVIELPPLGTSTSDAPARTTPLPVERAATTGVVVLVDDEPTMLRATARVLRQAGYTVYPFPTPLEVVEHLERHGPPDLLVTDVVMPTMNGPSLADQLRREHPDLPVLFVSGYADHASVRNAAWEIREHNLLVKPFSPSALLDSVARLVTDP